MPEKLTTEVPAPRPAPTTAPPRDREDSEPARLWRRVVDGGDGMDGMGVRYARCRFGSAGKMQGYRLFRPDVPPETVDGVKAADSPRERQAAVLRPLVAYAESVEERVKAGRNVVLFGPVGTGKDHLLAALCCAACKAGIGVAWTDGMRLFQARRDAIQSESSERDLLKRYTQPAVLAISDPVPPWGDLTQGQGELLFRVIDDRYRNLKPTWVTANFEDGTDAARRAGKQVVDRLRDGGLAVDCNWPSYRANPDLYGGDTLA